MKQYGQGRAWDDKSLAQRGRVLGPDDNRGNAAVQRDIAKTMADLLADNQRASEAKRDQVEIKQVQCGSGWVEPRALRSPIDDWALRQLDEALAAQDDLERSERVRKAEIAALEAEVVELKAQLAKLEKEGDASP
jgi:hypothetical protein